ncbi:TOBE domain-containing protein, partial [Candidatus Bathyarchaeota archaeon]|nr:TOBE domain-containing protein [Candidatus Bathyarchaeota archaeon]
ELYLTPQNIFVAHFIGESNFLEGYISNISGKENTIMLRGDLTVQAINHQAKQGERVVLAIRPEIFEIKKEAKDKNLLSGTIERVTFEGTNIRYEVRLENQDVIVVVKPSLAQEWFNIGEKVGASFLPEKAHIFTYPDTGLKEEIAVE